MRCGIWDFLDVYLLMLLQRDKGAPFAPLRRARGAAQQVSQNVCKVGVPFQSGNGECRW